MEWLNNQVELSKVSISYRASPHSKTTFPTDTCLQSFWPNTIRYQTLANLKTSKQLYRHNSAAMRNNFLCLKQSLRVLNIDLSSNLAISIIQKEPGAAEKLLYKLKMALEKITGSGTSKKGCLISRE